MFEEYRVNGKKDVIPTQKVRIKKKMVTRKEVIECQAELMYSSGLTPTNEIIFLARILEGKKINQIIAITEKDII
jgi:hypothetical protein